MISLELAVLDAGALLVWLGMWPAREQLMLNAALTTTSALDEAVQVRALFHDGREDEGDATLAGDLLEIQFAAMLVVPSTGLLGRTAQRWDERSTSWGLASAAALAEQENLPLVTLSGNVDGLTVIRLA